jgi:predicted transcriptional regulator of viral defense system
VDWSQTKGEWDFGQTVTFSQGMPIYVTDLERTLLDTIRHPDKSGGIVAVLHAWRTAAHTLNVDKLVGYVDRLGQPVIRQRTGYLLQTLGLAHPRLRQWQQNLQRGGSMRLVAKAPYSPTYSSDWNLSLNVPDTILAELDGD